MPDTLNCREDNDISRDKVSGLALTEKLVNQTGHMG